MELVLKQHFSCFQPCSERNLNISLCLGRVNHLHHIQLFKYRKSLTGKLCLQEESLQSSESMGSRSAGLAVWMKELLQHFVLISYPSYMKNTLMFLQRYVLKLTEDGDKPLPTPVTRL